MEQARDFVHLHNHTEYSLLDGACRIDKLFDRVKELGQKAVAITDHGVMYGCVQFYDKAKATGIKPIIGCEVYVATRTRHDKENKVDGSYHLILLCKDDVGYRNLIKMVSSGFTEGFYRKPRIDKELLEKYHEGLVCLSACLAGEIPQLILSDKMDEAKDTARWYKSLFGDDYYIELQDHGLEEDDVVTSRLISIARELNIQMVATNDAHYLTKEDAKAQEILLCVQTGKKLADPGHMKFGTDEFYIKSTDEMYDLFAMVPEACRNTTVIADKCNFDFEFGNTKLPAITAPNGMDNQTWFETMCWEGLERRYAGRLTQDLKDRLTYEIGVINKMGYTNYYLIVYDYINYARSQGIPVGPGRGSGAGSIAAYSIGITNIDPIKHNLIFERFLNPERVSMPDFDVDFCYERRKEVIDYVNRKYGSDHVCQIVTFGTMAAKMVLRDVGRVLDMDYGLCDKLSKMVPNDLHMTLTKALEVNQELKAIYDKDQQVKTLFDTSIKLEGMPRHCSTHAAGVVITRAPATEYVPLSTNDGIPVTQFNMVEIERLGLLKYDFLGLRTLTVISDAEKAIKKTDRNFSIDSIDYEDKETYKMLSSGDSEAVFQLESPGMRKVIGDLQPKNIEDLIAIISLYRPGPMDSIPEYVRNSKDSSLIQYSTPQLAHILDVTYGCIVYQEQVMQICRDLAGFSFGQADNVRRAMSKKKQYVMEAERKHFVFGNDEKGKECPGCVKNGIPENVANEIYDRMISFAAYAFNKAHAACYAYVSFQTAYLKCHYPKEYMAALLTSVKDATDKVIVYCSEARRMGIDILPPDINKSEIGFTVSNGKILFGLSAVKNAGDSLNENIIKERKLNGPYSSVYDFCKRMSGQGINRRSVESFAYAGTFDGFGIPRKAIVEDVEHIIKVVVADKKKNVEGQIDMFGMMDQEKKSDAYTIPWKEEYPKKEMLKKEKEVSGVFLSGHPLDEYSSRVEQSGKKTIKKILESHEFDSEEEITLCVMILSVKKVFTKASGEQMAFISFEDLTGKMAGAMFPKAFKKYWALAAEDNVVIVKGKITKRSDNEMPSLSITAVEDAATHIFKPRPKMLLPVVRQEVFA